LDSTQTNLDKAEEIIAVSIDSERYQNKDDAVCIVPDCRPIQDRSKENDVSMPLWGIENGVSSGKETTTVPACEKKQQGKGADRNINMVFNGAEIDSGVGKDFKADLPDGENDQGRDKNMRTVFGSAEKDHGKDKDDSTSLAGVEADFANDVASNCSERRNENGQMAEPDYLLLEPPEEFRVSSN